MLYWKASCILMSFEKAQGWHLATWESTYDFAGFCYYLKELTMQTKFSSSGFCFLFFWAPPCAPCQCDVKQQGRRKDQVPGLPGAPGTFPLRLPKHLHTWQVNVQMLLYPRSVFWRNMLCDILHSMVTSFTLKLQGCGGIQILDLEVSLSNHLNKNQTIKKTHHFNPINQIKVFIFLLLYLGFWGQGQKCLLYFVLEIFPTQHPLHRFWEEPIMLVMQEMHIWLAGCLFLSLVPCLNDDFYVGEGIWERCDISQFPTEARWCAVVPLAWRVPFLQCYQVGNTEAGSMFWQTGKPLLRAPLGPSEALGRNKAAAKTLCSMAPGGTKLSQTWRFFTPAYLCLFVGFSHCLHFVPSRIST